jgi:hypothetical protein
MFRMPPTPVCPHCREIAPRGDARHAWNDKHLESRAHRFWWKLRKVARRDKP